MDWSQPATVIAWAESQAWCHAMTQCEQNPHWHAEGNVWIHTKMVIAELVKSPNYQALPISEQRILLLAALLHDCGKPNTTIMEDGRIRSPGHSKAGARLARQILRDQHFSLEERERICNLIFCHGWPPYVADIDDPEMEVIKASWLCLNSQLVLLSLSDMRGRQGAIPTSYSLDAVSLWQDLAQQLDCFDKPYDTNSEGRIQALEGKDIRFYLPHEEFKCTMTLLAGVPGVGKDTWLRKHEPSLPVVSLDNLREEMEVQPTDNQGHVSNAAKEAVREYLRAGQDFAFNATNITKETRGRWIRLARDYNARVRLIYIEPPLEVIRKQNRDRKANVPDSIVIRLLDRIEVPMAGEAHELALLSQV